MKRIAFVLVAIAMVAGVVAITVPASEQADQEPAPIFLTEIPQDYRDLGLIAVSRLTAPNGAQLRAELGNGIAIKAYREGRVPFPDGAIIAALHWNEASSDANNQVLAKGFPGAGIQSFVPGSAVNIQFIVKDSKKTLLLAGGVSATLPTANQEATH